MGKTWTRLSLLMNLGFTDPDTINGLVGSNAGTKLRAFINTNVDLNKLMKYPEQWRPMELDAKYMACLMLSSWISDNIRKKNKIKDCLPLIDAMTDESREYAILSWTTLGKTNLIEMIKILMDYKPEYKEMLTEVAIKIKSEIALNQ